MGDRLRPVWDFDDLDASRTRFRALLDEETTDVGRAEVLTQLARVEGLQDRFADGDQLLDCRSGQLGQPRILDPDPHRGHASRSISVLIEPSSSFHEAVNFSTPSDSSTSTTSW